MEETISLKEIFDVIKKRLILIISITVGAALIAALLSYFLLTPVYEANTQFIVNQTEQEQPEDAQIDSGTIQTNVELINTYNVIIKSKAILDVVAEELALADTTEDLEDNIQVSSEEDSQVVTVTVKDPDPQQATNIANTTVEVFQDKITELMNVDNVNILSVAETKPDQSPVEPRPKLNIAIALVLGAMIGVGIAFLLEYLDTTIRTEEDVEQKLDVPIIGVISSMGPEDIRTHRGNTANARSGGNSRAKV